MAHEMGAMGGAGERSLAKTVGAIQAGRARRVEGGVPQRNIPRLCGADEREPMPAVVIGP
jgi:hypothetical protein